MEGSLWRNFRWMNMHILSFMIARFDSNISALLFFCSSILASGRTLASAIIVPFTIIMLLQQSIISLSWLHFRVSTLMFFVFCLMWNYTHRLSPQKASCWHGPNTCEDYGVPASEVKQKFVFRHTQPREDSVRSKKEKAPGLPRKIRKAI